MEASIKVFAPGRVNLLGEHIDYNDGIVLPVAIDRYLTITAAPTTQPIIHLKALDLNKEICIPIDHLAKKCDCDNNPLPRFALYPAGIAWALQQSGYPLCGLSASYTSNIPIGAGLSSSAAVQVGFALAFQALCGLEIDKLTLAKLIQTSENKYIGVQSGLMDQLAILFGEAGKAVEIDIRSLACKAIDLPAGVAIVVADSRVRRSLADSAYNQRRSECEEALSILKNYLPGISALRDININQFQHYAHFLPGQIAKRARHVIEEMARVRCGIALLNQNNIEGFGKLMVDCHTSLRDLYEVSCDELDQLVEIASSFPGCYGARLTGAGFGGCTVNLVNEALAHEFCDYLGEKYYAQTGKLASLYLCHASQSAYIDKQAQ